MTRADGIGLGAAAAGHLVLFALLSLAWLAPKAPPPVATPIEVSLVDDVALDQHAPAAPEPPSQSAAPDPGPPAEAPPAAAVTEVAPEPAPPKPKPAPVTPPKPVPPQPRPVAVPPPKAVAKPKPAEPKKPVAERVETAKAKVAPAKAPPAKAAPPPARPVALAARGNGASPKATAPKATGSLLDDDFRKGLTQSPSRAKPSEAAPGAVMDAKAAANISSAIQRQIQPCANQQVIPGPGADRIVATVRLQINRDGTLAGRPTVSDDHAGVDDENRRYVDAVDRAAITAFTRCAPLRGLPPELYDVPRGWKVFNLRYKMPG